MGLAHNPALNGYAWSSRSNLDADPYKAFYLYFDGTLIHTILDDLRFWGFPLRCLVR